MGRRRSLSVRGYISTTVLSSRSLLVWGGLLLLTATALLGPAVTGQHTAVPIDRCAALRDMREALSIPKEALNIGAVWPQADFRVVLPLTNRSERPITISRFHASCSCTRVSPSHLTLASQETRPLTVELKLDDASNRRLKASHPPAAVDIRIRPVLASAANAVPEWHITGRLLRLFVSDSPSVGFGEIVRSQQAASETIRVTGTVPVLSLTADCSHPQVAVECAFIDQEQRSAELTISLDPRCPAGPLNAEVVLNAVLADGTAREVRESLPIHALIVDELGFQPRLVHFGPQTLGEHCVATVSVRPRIDCKIEHMELLSTDPGLVPHLLPGGSGAPLVSLDQQVARAGHQVSTLRATARTTDGRMIRGTLLVLYHGFASTDVDHASAK